MYKGVHLNFEADITWSKYTRYRICNITLHSRYIFLLTNHPILTHGQCIGFYKRRNTIHLSGLTSFVYSKGLSIVFIRSVDT